MPEVGFRVSPRTMRMIGRQNVSSQFIAINELVKNAYDADSSDVLINFRGSTATKTGQIVITDHGTGMDLETIITKWLTIGTDNKEKDPVSALGRIRTGAKGIGRFALDRLGEESIIETFHSPDELGIRLTIDWNRYNDFSLGFESVKHHYEHIENTDRLVGTKITIDQIRDPWDEEDMQELYEDLSFLIPPLQPIHMDFTIQITSDDYPELNGEIEPTVHDNPEFLLESELSDSGQISHTLTHKSGTVKTFATDWKHIFDPPLLFDIAPSCGFALVNLRIFIGPEGRRVTSINVKDTAFKKYLKSFRGIRIYRDGFLVKPYGLKNNDWLGLSPRKIRQNQGVVQADLGDYRFSNHQIIGKVDISRIRNPLLEDRTNREGLIENSAFKDLKRYLMACISFVEIERQILESSKSDNTEPESPREVVKSVKKRTRVRKVSGTGIPEPQEATTDNNSSGTSTPEKIVHAANNERQLPESEADGDLDKIIEASERLISENDMLRALSTIGISAVTLSHELKADILSLNASHKIIAIEIAKIGAVNSILSDETLAISTSANRMGAWADLILKRTQSNRRKIAADYIDVIISDIVASFIKSSLGQNYTINFNVRGDPIPILIRSIDIEAIVINLISNSIKAIKRSANHPKCVSVVIVYDDNILLSVEDTGTGVRRHGVLIADGEVNVIFDPLISFNGDEGTGMGLAIVAAICKDNNWNVSVIPLNENGGATFNITIPKG